MEISKVRTWASGDDVIIVFPFYMSTCELSEIEI